VIIDQGARARRTTLYRPPPPTLRPWVSEGWIQRYPHGIRRASGEWRIVPDVQPHLLVHGGPEGARAPRLVGPRSTWLDRGAGGRGWTVGVTFRPGTWPLLGHLPAWEAADRSVPLSRVWPGEGDRLTDEVQALKDPLEVLERLLAGVSARAERAAWAVDWRVHRFLELARGARAPRVGPLAAALGVSTRGLRSVWRASVGLSPRRALSIDRLHRSVRLRLGAGPNWSRVAHRCGFYDQSHLIRDFHRYLGESPEDFMGRGGTAGSAPA